MIKYHQKKALFVGKKGHQFYLGGGTGWGHQYAAPLKVLPGTHGTTRSHHRASPVSILPRQYKALLQRKGMGYLLLYNTKVTDSQITSPAPAADWHCW